jgi:hypothetical protein
MNSSDPKLTQSPTAKLFAPEQDDFFDFKAVLINKKAV